MRGFPPLHLLIFMIGFGLFAIPLFQMTQGRKRTEVKTEESKATIQELVNGYLRIKFAHSPVEFSFTVDGKKVLKFEELGEETSLEKELSFPGELKVLEGLLHVKWSDETPETAITLEWEPDGYHSVQSTVWGEGEVDEVVNLAWK